MRNLDGKDEPFGAKSPIVVHKWTVLASETKRNFVSLTVNMNNKNSDFKPVSSLLSRYECSLFSWLKEKRVPQKERTIELFQFQFGFRWYIESSRVAEQNLSFTLLKN